MNDHRRLGRELELFCSDPLAGAGLPIWLPAGAAARHAVESYLYDLEWRAGYQHVYSPPLGKSDLYRKSGHLDHFAEDMFPPMALSEDDDFVLRPSLCPHHALVFRARQRSWRELPRAERSGVLGGLSRVRSISLNDSHNFCAPEQAVDEVAAVLSLMGQAHEALGVQIDSYRLSLRGPGGKYVDDPQLWSRAEGVLRAALDAAEVSYAEASGEAAFYGPKIDAQIVDPAGRESTLATVQVDFHLPERFDLSYVDKGGQRERPVVVHRSLVGSMERLFAHLIEVHGGAFPAWYAPVQVAVLPVGDDQVPSGRAFVERCLEAGLRAEMAADGSLGARIRAHLEVPYVAVIGAAEAEAGSVALRLRGGQRYDPLPAADAVDLVSRAVSNR
jgi:threonyl-tRNA synthetase